MRIHFDEETDALFISLTDAKIIESEEVQPGIILDYDANNEVVGIEILGVKRRIPSKDLKSILFQVA